MIYKSAIGRACFPQAALARVPQSPVGSKHLVSLRIAETTGFPGPRAAGRSDHRPAIRRCDPDLKVVLTSRDSDGGDLGSLLSDASSGIELGAGIHLKAGKRIPLKLGRKSGLPEYVGTSCFLPNRQVRTSWAHAQEHEEDAEVSRRVDDSSKAVRGFRQLICLRQPPYVPSWR